MLESGRTAALPLVEIRGRGAKEALTECGRSERGPERMCIGDGVADMAMSRIPMPPPVHVSVYKWLTRTCQKYEASFFQDNCGLRLLPYRDLSRD